MREYKITPEGDVYSGDKKLKPGLASNGYLTVCLNGDTHLIHRLVATLYLENPEDKRTVNHKDGNKLNNDVFNLEWATDSENALHSYQFLGRKPSQGRATISEETVKMIKTLLSDKVPQRLIAEFFAVKRSLVADISSGRSWKNV